MEKLLTAKEVAKKLSISVSAVYKWADERRINYINLGSDGKRRCIRFREEELQRIIEQKETNKLN